MDYVGEIIRNGQIAAKANSEVLRMSRTQMYLDYKNNIFRQYLCKLIDGMLGDTTAREELKKYIESDYTAERIINQICLVFYQNPKITPVLTSTNVDTQTKAKEELEEMLYATNFYAMLDEMEKLVATVSDVPIIPTINNGELKLLPVTGNMSFVEQDPKDPTKFIRFYYQVDILSNTVTHNQIIKYHYWELMGEWWTKFECNVSYDLHIDEDSRKEVPNSAKYPKELCPVTVFRDYFNYDCFWKEGNNAIIEKSIAIDLKRTDLAMAEAYNVPQMVYLGASEDDPTLKSGRMFYHRVNGDIGNENKDLKYINPNEALKEALDLIVQRYEGMALKEGLSKSVINGDTASSGYHLQLSLSQIIQANNKKRKYFTNSIIHLLNVAGYAWKDILKNPLYPVKTYNIDYAEIDFPTSTEEEERENALALANGTKNLVDIELERNPDLKDRKEALNVILERQKETNLINSTRFTQANLFEQTLELTDETVE